MKYIAKCLSTLWSIVWRSGLFLILWAFILAPAVVPVASRFKADEGIYPLRMLYFDAVGALTILAAAWLMVRLVDRRPFVSLGFASVHLVRDLLIGVITGAGWLGLSLGILGVAGCLRPQSAGSISWVNLAWTAGALVFNTLCQEMLARSYIFQTIQSRAGATLAILSTAVFFSACHAGAFHGAWQLPAFNVFVAGVLFGTAYYLSGNLWLPIAIHFSWNLLLGPVLGLTVSGQHGLNDGRSLSSVHGPALITGGSFGVEGGLVVTFTSIAFIGFMLLWFPRAARRAPSAPEETDAGPDGSTTRAASTSS